MNLLETKRLMLRPMTLEDAEFILLLLNDPSFLQYIGDKGVRNLRDAQQYILTGPLESYGQYGFGLYLVELKAGAVPIGICGLVKRTTLPDADLGFAFLPAFWGKGYAVEAAAEVFAYGREVLRLNRIFGITSPDNAGSIKVLKKLGLRFEGSVNLSEQDSAINLFVWDVEPAESGFSLSQSLFRDE